MHPHGVAGLNPLIILFLALHEPKIDNLMKNSKTFNLLSLIVVGFEKPMKSIQKIPTFKSDF